MTGEGEHRAPRSVLFVAWGKAHVDAVGRCIGESRLPDHPITLITDEDTDTGVLAARVRVIRHRFRLPPVKERKSEALTLVPPELGTVLFLDTDTRVLGDVSLGYEQAERHGIAIAPAPHYSLQDFRSYGEVMATEGIRPAGQLGYNSGVIFFSAGNARVQAVFARAWALILRHGLGWSDQPAISLAMELLGFNPYTLSSSFNHRGLGELISGTVRIWHSTEPVPAGIDRLDAGHLRRVDEGRIARAMKVPRTPVVGPQIIVHVGAPKTGSTALQHQLRADPAVMRAHGVYVPVPDRLTGTTANAKLLAVAISGPSAAFLRHFPALARSTLDPQAITDELLAGWQRDREVLVLSAENFRWEHAERLRAVLPRDARCMVVLWVRRQDRWTESWFNQILKMGAYRGDLTDFVALMTGDAETPWRRPDWSQECDAWSEHFERCETFIYEETRDAMLQTLLGAAGVPVPPVAPAPFANASIDAHSVAYLLGLPPDLTHDDFQRRRRASEEAARQLGAPPAGGLLSDADQAAIRDRYEASNRRLMARLGRPYEGSPLELPEVAESPGRLAALRATPAFRAHTIVANALYVSDLKLP